MYWTNCFEPQITQLKAVCYWTDMPTHRQSFAKQISGNRECAHCIVNKLQCSVFFKSILDFRDPSSKRRVINGNPYFSDRD